MISNIASNIVDCSTKLPAILLTTWLAILLIQQYCWFSNIDCNIVSNNAEYAAILLISNIADKIVSNIDDSAILSGILVIIHQYCWQYFQQYCWQYFQQYCWRISNMAGNVVSNIASNIEPGPTSILVQIRSIVWYFSELFLKSFFAISKVFFLYKWLSMSAFW